MFLLLQFNTILNAQHNTNKHTAYYLLTSYLSLSVATHYRTLQLLYSRSFFLFFFLKFIFSISNLRIFYFSLQNVIFYSIFFVIFLILRTVKTS